jgi:hypothetical protein
VRFAFAVFGDLYPDRVMHDRRMIAELIARIGGSIWSILAKASPQRDTDCP